MCSCERLENVLFWSRLNLKRFSQNMLFFASVLKFCYFDQDQMKSVLQQDGSRIPRKFEPILHRLCPRCPASTPNCEPKSTQLQWDSSVPNTDNAANQEWIFHFPFTCVSYLSLLLNIFWQWVHYRFADRSVIAVLKGYFLALNGIFLLQF